MTLVARTALLPAAALLVLGALACDPPQGEEVTCARTWSCDDNVVSTQDDVHCTDPGKPGREDQITAYEAGFAESCDGVRVGCGGDVFATCAAVCTPSGICPLEEADNIRL
jgi:hypothetical protein